MALTTRSHGQVCILTLSGRFDAHLAPAVKEWHERSAATMLAVDLSGVTFVDSMALATLAGAMKRCRQKGGDLRIFGLQQAVRIIFELTRMNRAFQVFETEAEAVASFETVAAG